MCSLLPFFSLLLICATGSWAMDVTMPFMEYLDQEQLVCLKWGFDNPVGDITFQLAVNTTGWVGFGLSPNGDMKGSDIVIGGVGSSGSYFSDQYATGNSMPLEDAQQSYTLLSVRENEGQTVMTFKRPIKTCDDKDFQITAQPIKLIFAYGETDEISYHESRRGTKEVNLLNYMPKSIPTNSSYLSAMVDNIIVPSNTTYYHCKVMKLPKLNTKHHIYQIEPVIDHLDLVHHMLLYHCPPKVTEPYDKPCYMGDIGDSCFGVVASWGVGGGVYKLPENVGIPIGGENSDALYRLEIHYNNPERKEGIKDSSGLRLHYTAKLRQHDVGIMTTGVLPGRVKYDIPAKANQFLTYAMCNTSYFSKFFNPVPDLQVFAVLLHTHLAGRKVRVGHFRNERQIDFLGIDENYNFDLQQTVSLGSIKTIKQGDEIVVECTYNTTNRASVTKMGLATTDEMCLAFLFYYPAINITSCVSIPDARGVPMDAEKIPVDKITEYEMMLKKAPQYQAILNSNHNTFLFQNGTVRDLMKTPAACQIRNTSNRFSTSWIVNLAGIILVLLWIILM
ncbi:DBH-like monooxygenase protein 2 homolog isoform X1 [Oreochromis aureus]|uniref:DOMON domain-containing protein n=1 Tax=Oreochromis aureus TaxID=47969 RepID=A0A668TE99_OREAU|nr:DBH-like monooxygenase protein 2 homolog isoform X1 [Oreochromis aureus]